MVLLRPGHLHQNSTIRGRPWDVVCRLGPVWINHKKAKINPENTDDKYFQYAATVALIYKISKWNPDRVSNIKQFTNK